MNNSMLFHDCDADFKDNCGSEGGTFECVDQVGDKCYEGTCTIPRS